MPFKGFDDVHDAIRRGVKEAQKLRPDLANLEPIRADDLRGKVVLEKILGQVGEAKVVIADLTGRNENVFYELGIAQTLKDNVILLAQSKDDVPSDLQPFEYVPYTKSEAGLEKLVTDLAEAIRQQPLETPTSIQQDWGTPQDMKRQLRQALARCEGEWADEVVPLEAKKFYERFPALRTSPSISIPVEEWDESLRIHLPGFLRPWLPVEAVGLEAIMGAQADAILPDLMLALEQAYTHWERVTPQQPNTITTHSSLLALRTWTLWGAAALDRENWAAVEALLNRPTGIGPNRPSLAQLRHLHYPAAAGGLIHVAARSVEEQPSAFASQHFGDPESMQAFIGFWRFAADLAARAADQWMLQTWAVTARTRFEGLVARLGTDAEYARRFVRAVCLTDVQSLNEEWQQGLHDYLTSRSRLGDRQRGWILPSLPKRFAE